MNHVLERRQPERAALANFTGTVGGQPAARSREESHAGDEGREPERETVDGHFLHTAARSTR